MKTQKLSNNSCEVTDITPASISDMEIGVYGRMRERYLRKHHPDLCASMILAGTLAAHLREIDEMAQRYVERMVPRMAAAAGITEELKAKDQMAWVGRMNMIRAQVEEMIRTDLIYC